MSYTKQTWQSGDTITAQKLNHIEDGIANGGVLVVHSYPDPDDPSTDVLDKTWQQIHDAAFSVLIGTTIDQIAFGYIELIGEDPYSVDFTNVHGYEADSADGYPYQGGK